MSPSVRLGIIIGIFATALVLEKWRPLRKPTQPKNWRVLINIGVATTAAVVLRFTFYPVVMSLASQVELSKLGILPQLHLSGLTSLFASIVLLDWTLYYWHWMLHKTPFLWRFHNAHHIDLDLDSSTALRFHFGELAISTVFRSAQIIIFGITPYNLALFEILITSFAQFHHSNVEISATWEKVLNKVFISPRLHGIHHSTVRSETDSNFGTIFTWWDFLHRTFLGRIPQNEIVIGVPSYRDPNEQSLLGVLSVPFRPQRAWRYPDGLAPIEREALLPNYPDCKF